MSVLLTAAMDRTFALLRSIGGTDSPDVDRRILTETIRMALSSFMGGKSDNPWHHPIGHDRMDGGRAG